MRLMQRYLIAHCFECKAVWDLDSTPVQCTCSYDLQGVTEELLPITARSSKMAVASARRNLGYGDG